MVGRPRTARRLLQAAALQVLRETGSIDADCSASDLERRGCNLFRDPDPWVGELPPFDHDPAGLGRLYENLLDEERSRRKGSGSFYTPPELAQSTLKRLPTDLASICDPAAGGGAFLMAALQAGFAHEAIHGIDRDSLGVDICRLALWMTAGDPQLPMDCFDSQVRVGDALELDWNDTFPKIADAGGFEAVIGNPPWETVKPDSRAFFGRFDPEFSRLGKQEARRRGELLCRDPEIARAWREEREGCSRLARRAREQFELQGGGDPNLYKLFLELGLRILRTDGWLALLVPAALYTDYGGRELRKHLLRQCRWHWCYGFENRERLFPIDSRFKYCAVVVQKGGHTESLRTAFLQRDLSDWQRSAPQRAFAQTEEEIHDASPEQLALVEFTSEQDRDLFHGLRDRGEPIAEAWGVRYGRELDTTLDSELFVPRPELEAQGFAPGPGGIWEDRTGAKAWPLYEGRMIDAYEHRAKAWVEGRGRRARWRAQGPDEATPGPQYLIRESDLTGRAAVHPGPKLAFMRIGSATNARSCIATILDGQPCADSLFTYVSATDSREDLSLLCALLNSFPFDFQLRCRLSGLNLSGFVMGEMRVPGRERLAPYAAEIQELVSQLLQGTSSSERGLRARLEGLVARAWGLSEAEYRHILRDCGHSSEQLRSHRFTRALTPKGFWRVDRELPPAQRLPAMARAAFATTR